MTIKQLIAQLGETDQLYLAGNSPQLALQRANLRLELVAISQYLNEQTYFLNEAIAILEQARLEFEDLALDIYLDLSIQLASAYLHYYELKQEERFATIAQQILKPLAHHQHGEIFFLLAYISAIKKHPALTQHWLIKYSHTPQFDLAKLQHPLFEQIKTTSAFQKILKDKLS